MTTDPHMDPLDDSLKRAMKALDDQVSDRHFDELHARTLARLEETMQSEARPTAGTPVPVAATPAPSAAKPADSTEKPPRDEDSGLHDIRALASSAKARVSKKRPTINPPIDDTVLHTSSASLRAVALPEPSKMVQTGEHAAIVGSGTGPHESLLADAPVATAATTTATPSPITPLVRRKSKAPVVLGTVLAAAAAGVVGFMYLQQQEKDEGAPSATSAAPTVPVAAKEAAAAPDVAPAPAPTTAITEGVGAAGAAAFVPDTGSSAGAALPRGDVDGKKDDHRERLLKDRDKDKDRDRDKKDIKKDGNAAAPVEKPVSDSTPPKKDDKKGDGQDQSLDELLREAGVDSTAPKKPDAPKIDKKGLDATDIRKAMSALNGKAQACYAKFGVSGSVAVKLTVAPSGEIKKAVVTGAAAGTPTGECVQGVVHDAKFPAWDGPPSTVNYSYFLSE